MLVCFVLHIFNILFMFYTHLSQGMLTLMFVRKYWSYNTGFSIFSNSHHLPSICFIHKITILFCFKCFPILTVCRHSIEIWYSCIQYSWCLSQALLPNEWHIVSQKQKKQILTTIYSTSLSEQVDFDLLCSKDHPEAVFYFRYPGNICRWGLWTYTDIKANFVSMISL
jgi:hypothetical protein